MTSTSYPFLLWSVTKFACCWFSNGILKSLMAFNMMETDSVIFSRGGWTNWNRFSGLENFYRWKNCICLRTVALPASPVPRSKIGSFYLSLVNTKRRYVLSVGVQQIPYLKWPQQRFLVQNKFSFMLVIEKKFLGPSLGPQLLRKFKFCFDDLVV